MKGWSLRRRFLLSLVLFPIPLAVLFVWVNLDPALQDFGRGVPRVFWVIASLMALALAILNIVVMYLWDQMREYLIRLGMRPACPYC